MLVIKLSSNKIYNGNANGAASPLMKILGIPSGDSVYVSSSLSDKSKTLVTSK